MSEETDWMWVYENPKEAAAEIDRLKHQIACAKHLQNFDLHLINYWKNKAEEGFEQFRMLMEEKQRLESSNKDLQLKCDILSSEEYKATRGRCCPDCPRVWVEGLEEVLEG